MTWNELKSYCKLLETYLKHDDFYDLDGEILFEELKFIREVSKLESKSRYKYWISLGFCNLKQLRSNDNHFDEHMSFEIIGKLRYHWQSFPKLDVHQKQDFQNYAFKSTTYRIQYQIFNLNKKNIISNCLLEIKTYNLTNTFRLNNLSTTTHIII